MPDPIQLPSDIELKDVTLVLGTGQKVDITDLVFEISVYEALDQASTYGRVVVVDATGIITRANISGQEIFMFTVKKMDGEEEHLFHLSKIEQVDVISQTTTQYTFSFIERSYVIDSMSLVSQAYEGTVDSTIKQIYKDYLAEEFLEEPDECTGNYRFVIPNWNPLKAIKWLSQRAVDSNGVPVIFFKSFRRGPRLLSYDTMFNSEFVQEYFVNQTPSKETAIEGNQSDYIGILSKPQTFGILQHGNALSQIRNGTFSQTAINVDTTRKGVMTLEFKDNFEKSPRLNKNLPITEDVKYGPENKNIRELFKTKQTIHYSQGGSFGEEFLNYDSTTNEIITSENNYRGMLGTYVYEMAVHGRFDLEPGRLVNIVFPSNIVQNEQDPEKNIDNKRSGKHLILACQHSFKRDKYTVVLEVATDGFGEEYGSE